MEGKMSVSGSGYTEFMTDDDRVYIHRLSAVAEHGVEAVKEKDVHHTHDWDGVPCKWVNARDRLEPEDPTEHRKRTLNNVER